MIKTITKEFTFDSAHRLHNKKISDEENRNIFDKCNDIHGHTYHLFITISGKEENGMIMNFVDLKNIVHKNIIEIFDHKYLNDCVEMKGKLTTCENMSEIIWDLLINDLLMYNVILEEIKLCETETSFVTLKRK